MSSVSERAARGAAPRVARREPPGLVERLGRYGLRFARDEADVEQIQALRFEVFNVELGEGLAESWRTRRDVDRFDGPCDHLMVEDERSRRVVGTYRLQTRAIAEAGEGFYSAGEFALEELPRSLVDASIELGRACIAREHRNGRVLYLLWRGLAAYARHHGKRWFFGCSSLTGDDPALGLAAWEWLRERGRAHTELLVQPLPGWECVAGEEAIRAATVEIPRLFATYLRYGAKILGPPALDRAFRTIDFLALLDLAEVAPEVLRSFEAPRPGA